MTKYVVREKDNPNIKALYNVEQKRFIVKAFERNTSSASLSREFLFYFKLTGRDASKLYAHFFFQE